MWKTRSVQIGHIFIGNGNKIAVQSMTNIKTSDIEQSINQIKALSDEGCDIVRLAIQNQKDIRSIAEIKNRLIKDRYFIPLVADIHFYPQAALEVVDYVEKVRINPGNYASCEFQIRSLFLPLVEKCKKEKKALRIGANHGSIHKEIKEKIQDPIDAMIYSLFTYAEICIENDFHDFVFSLKGSNPLDTIAGYRKLAANMKEKGWDYPLHLGVTEAGSEREGRVKSSIGIGTLLLEGIGDTIRVSLTEDPIKEIEPARKIINYSEKNRWNPIQGENETIKTMLFSEKEQIDSSFDKILYPDDLKTLSSNYLFLKENPLDEVKNYLLKNKKPPVVLLEEREEINLAVLSGTLLINQMIEGFCLLSQTDVENRKALTEIILQAAGKKKTKTEFISCPGCGRTRFDIQKVVKKVKEQFSNYPERTIAVMGCIVNGPGEMEGADFGIIGRSSNRVDLYKKNQCIKKDLLIEDAIQYLDQLLKSF